MPQIQQVVALGDGSSSQGAGVIQAAQRIGQMGDSIVSEMQARYYEQAYRKHSFWGANQAAQAVSVALATTYTGICLSNPAGSTVNLVPKKLAYALTVAPAAIASIGVILGYAAGGVTAHTTALTPQSSFIGNGAVAVGKIDSACTLVGTPQWGPTIQAGFTAATLPGTGPALIDLEGLFVIPPGGYIALGALTAITGLGFISWDEVPV